jgi:hypothetical protein
VAIDVNRARAALARVAPDVRTGQSEILPQDLDEEPPWLDIHLPWLAVHLECHMQLGHGDDLLSPVERGSRRGCGARPLIALGVSRADGEPDGGTVTSSAQPGCSA